MSFRFIGVVRAHCENESEKILEVAKKYNCVIGKTVVLDSQNQEDNAFILKIKDVFDKQKLKNVKELQNILDTNPVYELEEGVFCSVRKMKYSHGNSAPQILECTVYLMAQAGHDDFEKFINEFNDFIKIDDVTIKFLENKRMNTIRQNCLEIVEDILKGKNFIKPIEKHELNNVLRESYAVDSLIIEEGKKSELAQKATSSITSLIIEIISPEEISIYEVSKMIQDINVCFGNYKEFNELYAVKVDKDCEKLQTKLILIK